MLTEVFEEGMRVGFNNSISQVCTHGTKKLDEMISYFLRIICATFVNFSDCSVSVERLYKAGRAKEMISHVFRGLFWLFLSFLE